MLNILLDNFLVILQKNNKKILQDNSISRMK